MEFGLNLEKKLVISYKEINSMPYGVDLFSIKSNFKTNKKPQSIWIEVFCSILYNPTFSITFPSRSLYPFQLEPVFRKAQLLYLKD